MKKLFTLSPSQSAEAQNEANDRRYKNLHGAPHHDLIDQRETLNI